MAEGNEVRCIHCKRADGTLIRLVEKSAKRRFARAYVHRMCLRYWLVDMARRKEATV